MSEKDCLDREKGASLGKNINYSLLLSKKVLSEVQRFSKRYCMSENNFIAILLKLELEVIKSDVDNYNFNLINNYLEISESRRGTKYDIITKENTQELQISIQSPLIDAVEIFCDLILWTPERFIERSIESWIYDLNTRINESELEFFQHFFDFDPLLKAIDEVMQVNYKRGVEDFAYYKK
jgi:hypothetical protein